MSFLRDARISGAMLWQTYPVIRIVAGIAIGAFLFIWIIKVLHKKAGRPNLKPAKAVGRVWFFIFFLACAVAIFGRMGQYPLRWSDAFNTGNDFNANLALNPFQSFFSSLKFRTSTYDKEKVKLYYPFMAGYLAVDKPDIVNLNFKRSIRKQDSGMTGTPNVVLVICESFSAYKSSMWNNPLNTTPYFNEMCKRGTFFDNCFTPHIGTARGVWATITGIPDVELSETASRNPSMVDQHTIINDFEGYEKFYFLGGSTSWANIRGLLTNNIHNLHLYEEDKYKVPKIDVWGISDKNLFLEANDVLKEQTKPFFAIIQTADNHRPYTIPEEDQKEFLKQTLPLDSIRKYGFESNEELNAFRYTDFCYRKFMEAARQSGYFENTIFVFVGDHGIAGNAGDMFPPAWTEYGLTAYHVPLLFYSPRWIPAKRIHSVASQVDILPTTAGLANIKYTNHTLGRDLLRQTNDSARDNIAFIIDHNDNDVGIVKSGYFYNRKAGDKKEDFVRIDSSQSGEGIHVDSLKNDYRTKTSSFFETARFMLLHNRKGGD